MKKLTPVKIVHLVLIVILLAFSVYAAIKMFSGAAAAGRAMMILYGIVNVLNVGALCASAVYLLNSYGKKAADWYKAFLYLNVVVTVLLLIVDIFYIPFSFVLVSSIILLAVKAAALAVLTFKKDLGKKNTWIVFYVLLGLDVMLIVLTFINATRDSLVFMIHGSASRLINDLTIALAIRGKYADKEQRGSK